MANFNWTTERLALMRSLAPKTSNKILAYLLGCSIDALTSKKYELRIVQSQTAKGFAAMYGVTEKMVRGVGVKQLQRMTLDARAVMLRNRPTTKKRSISVAGVVKTVRFKPPTASRIDRMFELLKRCA